MSQPKPKILGVAYHVAARFLPQEVRPAVGDGVQFRVISVTERDYLPAGVSLDVTIEFVRWSPATADLPPIVFAHEAKESWIAQIEAAVGWNAQITLTDGATHDVVLRGHVYGPGHMLGLAVQYWVGDKEPADDAPVEEISSLDIARVRIY